MENKELLTLTNSEKKLIDELRRHEMDKDSVLCISISLSKENKIEEMLEWLSKQSAINRDSIFSKWYEIMGIPEPD